MIYKCKVVVSDKDLPNIMTYCADIQPVYKTEEDKDDIDYVSNINFLYKVCDDTYEEYCKHFSGKKILTQRKFYALVKRLWGAEIRGVRMGSDIKTMFFPRN